MDHPISIDGSDTRAMQNGRLKALKARIVPTPDNQQFLGDSDLNKIMDPYLYQATIDGDVDKFISALEAVSMSRRLALSSIFDQVTPSGNSLLHVAARSGKDDITELILFHFPYLATRKNSSEETPLHVAVQDVRIDATKMLIRLGTVSEIIYWKNMDSKSPLYLAAETGCLEILQLLLEASARDEAYAVKIQGRSPVLAALEGRKSDILERIIDWLPKLLHSRDENGRTLLHSALLHSAAPFGDVRTVQFLLRKCSYLALQTDENGSYPIHIAFEGSNVETIRELVQMWPDLAEIKNKKGQNILHAAAKGGNNKAVRFILGECSLPVIKKLVNLKDVDGNTPLHLASMHNRCRVLFSLTRHDVTDLKLLNNDELTALDVAMESRSLSSKSSPLLGRALLITAGVPRSKGRDVRSPREQSSGASKSSRAKWIKDQVNTRLIVATLVASVTFTAGFTLPGGYNAASDPHPGTATMLHNRVFQLFVISNMLAMYSSILAVVVLLWGHIADFYISEQAYYSTGPLLLTSVTGMSVAFLAAITLAVSKLSWLANLVLCITVLYLTMLILVLAALIFTFSKSAMRIVSLYYLVVALSVAAVRHLVTMYWAFF